MAGMFDDLVPGGQNSKAQPKAESGPWDSYKPAKQTENGPWSEYQGGAFDDLVPKSPEKSSLARRLIGDTAVSAVKGAIGLTEVPVGIADMATGGMAGKALEGIGYRPKEAKAMLDEMYSPEQKAANKAVSDAEGFFGTAKAALQNPSTIGQSVIESSPLLLPGAAIARGVGAAGKIAPVVAGGIGEGVVGAGLAAEQMRQNSEDGTLSARKTGAALASGAGTAAFGIAGGKLAQSAIGKKFGLADVDTALAMSPAQRAAAGGIDAGLAKRIAGGAVSEGVLEELPQSMWEQAAQNYGEVKPIGEGVAEAGAMGALAGGVMGGGFNALPGRMRGTVEQQPPVSAQEASMTEAPQAPSNGIDFEAGLVPGIDVGAPRQDGIPAGDMPGIDFVPAKLPVTGPLSAAVNVGIDSGATSITSPANPRYEIPAQPRGSFAQLDELASLIGQERADVADRRELAQLVGQERRDQERRIAEAADSRRALDAALADTDQRAAGVAAQESEAARLRLLDNILSSISDTGNPARQFGNALRRAGYRNTDFTERERQVIQRFSDARAALRSPEVATVPAAPNELDAASLGIRERSTAGAMQGASGRDKIGEAVSLLSQGWKLALNKTLVSPTGKRRKLNAEEFAAVREARAKMINKTEAGNAATQVDAVSDQGRGDVAAGGIGNAQPVRSIARRRGRNAGAPVPGMRAAGAVGNAGGAGSALNAAEFEQVAQEAAQANGAQVASAGDQIAIKSASPSAAMIPAKTQAENQNPIKNAEAAPAGAQQQQKEPKNGMQEGRRQEEVAANQLQAEAAPKPANQTQIKRSSPIMRRDDLVGAIMRVTGGNGIAANMAQTITGDKAGRGNPSLRGLFQNAGTMDLDDTAELLRTQEGYDVRDGNHLAELIREQAAGNSVVSMERAERDAADNAEKEYRAAVNERASSMGLKRPSGKRTLQMVEADIARIEAEIEAKEREISDMEAREERAAIQAESVYDEIFGADLNESDWMTWLSANVSGTYTQEEIDNVDRIQADREDARAAANTDGAADIETQAGTGGRQGFGANEAQAGGTGGRARGAAEGFSLTRQTNEQAAEQFARQQAGEPEAPTKEQADRERDAVPFSMQQQSQPKPHGVQTGLFTADGRVSSGAAVADVSKIPQKTNTSGESVKKTAENEQVEPADKLDPAKIRANRTAAEEPPSDSTGQNFESRSATSSLTINVDGVDRPRMNSNGKPIAQTDEGLRNFWRWFGDSKVTDDQGRPLVVYHGTRRPFDVFSPSNPRGAIGNQKGVYFTADKSVAEEYAQDVDGAWDEKSRVIAAYIKIESDADGKVIDSAYSGREYVVFKPENIKSATENSGDFDGGNPDIRESRSASPADAEFSATERAYGGREAFDRAKAAGKTKLNYRQWVQVRTPKFKEWFGDWEAAKENESFNAILKQVENGAIKSGTIIQLGTAGSILNQFGIPSLKIEMTQSVLSQHMKKHGIGFDHLRDLAAHVQAPIAVFKSKRSADSVILLTEIQHPDGDLVVELQANKERNRLVINDIRSIHPKPSQKIDFWIDDGLLIGVDESRGRHLLSTTDRSNSGRGERQEASDVILFNTEALRNVSKVVDPETGEPLVVYHGTDKIISKTSKSKPFFVTENAELASWFAKSRKNPGSVMPLYVAARNPFDYENEAHADLILERLGIDIGEGYGAKTKSELMDGDFVFIESDQVQKAIRSSGFDSFYAKEDTEKTLALYKPEQIKSATGNNGNFDGGNPDIRESRADGDLFSGIAATVLQDEVFDGAGSGPNGTGNFGVTRTVGPHGERLISIPVDLLRTTNGDPSGPKSGIQVGRIGADNTGNRSQRDARSVNIDRLIDIVRYLPSAVPSPWRSDAATLESKPNGRPVQASHGISDLLIGGPLLSHLKRLIDVPGQRISVMKPGVIFGGQNFKIVDGVIQSIPVDMMNVFVSGKTAAGVSFHNQPVFILPSDSLIENVALLDDISSALRPSYASGFGHSTPSHKNTFKVRRYNDLVKKFKDLYAGASALDIRVVATREEIPDRYRPSIYAEGVYHQETGLVYLVASNVDSDNRLMQILMHEAIGHYGMANMMGDQFSSLWETVLKRAVSSQPLNRNPQPGEANYETVDAVRRLYPEASDAEVAQEVLARMAETMPNVGWFRMAMARIRIWLKNAAKALGLKLEPTMDDVRRLVELAGYHVRSGANLERAPAGQDAVFASQRGSMQSKIPAMDDYQKFDPDRAYRQMTSRLKFSDEDMPVGFDVTIHEQGGSPINPIPREFTFSAQNGKDGVSLNVSEQTGDNGDTVFSSSLEAYGDQPKGTGIATKMYLSALNVAQKRGIGWMSEGVRSDESLAMYRRLKNAGVPFVEVGGASYVSADALNGVDLQAVADKLGKNNKITARNRDNFYQANLGAMESRAAAINMVGSLADQMRNAGRRMAGSPALDESDPFAAENARLREQDKSLWVKAKTQLRRYLSPGGLLPQSVFAEKIKRDSEFQAVEFDIRHLIGGLERAAKSDFGVSFDKLSDAQMSQISEALAGSVPAGLPDATKAAAVAMRQYIDGMSSEYMKIIQDKIDAKMERAIETGKASDAAQAINDIELYEKIKGNIGRYVHRSYQAFDNPKWFEKVPTSVLNSARAYLKQGYVDSGETDAKAAQLAEVTLHEILKNGTAYDSMEAFIAESKLGAKDLSVLMRRKDVPPEIRALLGEYSDARLNFTKSATKMGRLIWNTRFLDRVRDIGVGSFFFEGKDRPPAATTQIAAEGSEIYSPLNGLWTFPEIAQAFKDAMGKEQMSELYRAIVRANGIVKYGKTVLSPTTAMRNWQSAMFFSLANGHFDLTQMKKSIAAFREQVSQTATGNDLKYLRHLKQLGVVYDTPYAGEMARLLEDAKMEELLSSGSGDAVRLFRKANQIAQGFYSFGDDFWKIIGFENEKAGLMKAGLSLQDAELEAAKRIRDTYPTYSMVGRGVQWLSRFPLAGTFVSFPAEIIRTSSNMLRTVASDLKSDNPKLRELGMRRAAGMAFVSAAFWALSALSKAMVGVDDDEEEAIRDLAPEWQKNSTFLFAGRDEKGNLRYFDMSFLDPYGYWKRPITAMMRDQPWEDSLASGLRGMLEPFLGADITAGAIFEAVANQKQSGGKVYKENDGAIDQAVDIADHLRKALQPGFVGNIERITKAAADVRKPSGQPYSMEDELVALGGWRATTVEPKTALYYRSFEFTDAIAEARKTLSDALRDANSVSEIDIEDAKARAAAKQEKAFIEMRRLIGAAESAGLSKMQVMQTLRLSNVSQQNIAALMQGRVPPVVVTPQMRMAAVSQARTMRGEEFANEVFDRYRMAMGL